MVTYVSHREPMKCVIHTLSAGIPISFFGPARRVAKVFGERGREITHMARSKKSSTPATRKKPPPVQKATPNSVVAAGAPRSAIVHQAFFFCSFPLFSSPPPVLSPRDKSLRVL